MAESHTDALTLGQRHHFLLRKLHSLSGIVPIGVFLIEHLLTNSMAAYGELTGKGGREAFNEQVLGLHGLPYLFLLEVFGIFLPLAFHALYGIRIAMTAKHNVAEYPYMDNQRYFLQRMTGYIAFLFLIVHLAKFRFAHWFGGVPFLDPGIPDKFEITRRGLMEWVLPPGVTLTLYIVGLAASVYHFANGICTFCISWGITIGQKAQRRVALGATAVGLVLFVWGAASLYAFAKAPSRPLEGWDEAGTPADAPAAAHVMADS